LADLSEYAALNKVYATYFEADNTLARAAFQVVALPEDARASARANMQRNMERRTAREVRKVQRKAEAGAPSGAGAGATRSASHAAFRRIARLLPGLRRVGVLPRTWTLR
jgi:hypothetical protein